MKKRTLIALLLALCLTFTAVSGLAQGIIFSNGEGSTGTGGSLFSEDSSVSDHAATFNDSGSGFSIDLLSPIAPADEGNPLCCFLPATWDQVYNDVETAKSLIQGKHTTPSGREYTIPSVTIESGAVSGVIKVRDDGFDDLKAIWQELGNDLMDEFDDMKEVDGIEDSLKAYAFTNDETYLRFEFIDAGSYRFIVFVALPQK